MFESLGEVRNQEVKMMEDGPVSTRFSWPPTFGFDGSVDAS